MVGWGCRAKCKWSWCILQLWAPICILPQVQRSFYRLFYYLGPQKQCCITLKTCFYDYAAFCVLEHSTRHKQCQVLDSLWVAYVQGLMCKRRVASSSFLAWKKGIPSHGISLMIVSIIFWDNANLASEAHFFENDADATLSANAWSRWKKNSEIFSVFSCCCNPVSWWRVFSRNFHL